MPIEIRELVIKASIESEGGGQSGSTGWGPGNNSAATEELVNTCVEKVLEILKAKNER